MVHFMFTLVVLGAKYEASLGTKVLKWRLIRLAF